MHLISVESVNLQVGGPDTYQRHADRILKDSPEEELAKRSVRPRTQVYKSPLENNSVIVGGGRQKNGTKRFAL